MALKWFQCKLWIGEMEPDNHSPEWLLYTVTFYMSLSIFKCGCCHFPQCWSLNSRHGFSSGWTFGLSRFEPVEIFAGTIKSFNSADIRWKWGKITSMWCYNNQFCIMKTTVNTWTIKDNIRIKIPKMMTYSEAVADILCRRRNGQVTKAINSDKSLIYRTRSIKRKWT